MIIMYVALLRSFSGLIAAADEKEDFIDW